MRYNRLGRAGIKVSELSFGAWLTFGPKLDLEAVKACMRFAFENGVNFFDNAETYADGQAETLMGEAIKDYRREDLVISTKIFWGGRGPNDTGLSWKHLVEGTNAALKRLRLEYVDLLYCHRPDPNVPMEEVVRCMDHLIRRGSAFYWGTSEWSAEEIKAAHRVAGAMNCIPPVMEQPQYNLLARARMEREYAPLFLEFGMGITTWSPLASGILTGKYNHGIPKKSRLAEVEWLKNRLDKSKIEKVQRLEPIAMALGATLSQVAIAWCLKNPNVSTVILGATNVEQLRENLAASTVRDRLTSEHLAAIDDIFPV